MKIPISALKTLKRPKIFIPVVVAGAALGAWMILPGSGKKQSAITSFYKVERGPFTITLPTGGSLEAVDRVTVRNQVPGRT